MPHAALFAVIQVFFESDNMEIADTAWGKKKAGFQLAFVFWQLWG